MEYIAQAVALMYVIGRLQGNLWEWAYFELSELLCLSERLDFGAGQRGSDNRGWTVPTNQLHDIY